MLGVLCYIFRQIYSLLQEVNYVQIGTFYVVSVPVAMDPASVP